jgi:anthranilate phosphoribosyltransferase
MQKIVQALQMGRNLSPEEARSCVDQLLNPDLSNTLKAEVLMSLAEKGETVEEILTFSQVLLEKSLAYDLPRQSIDLCGTGGAGHNRFNVSTTSAFILAGAGIPVMKHGNKGSKRPNGSFDLLDQLGLRVNFTPEEQKEVYAETGLCFLFARMVHPAMKAVVGARKLAGRRTIFNIVGPLCNPVKPHFQVVGTIDQNIGRNLLAVMERQGRKGAMVVMGEPGIDEISIAGQSRVWDLRGESVQEYTLRPEDFGMEAVPYSSLPGGDAPENAKLFLDLIQGKGHPALTNMVLLNAGAAITCFSSLNTIAEGVARAKDSLETGKAFVVFERYKSLSI